MLSVPNLTDNIPPTIEEVAIYFDQRGVSFCEAECFFLFYEKKGWKNKKGAFFKSWKNIAYQWVLSILKYEPWRFNKDIH